MQKEPCSLWTSLIQANISFKGCLNAPSTQVIKILFTQTYKQYQLSQSQSFSAIKSAIISLFELEIQKQTDSTNLTISYEQNKQIHIVDQSNLWHFVNLPTFTHLKIDSLRSIQKRKLNSSYHQKSQQKLCELKEGTQQYKIKIKFDQLVLLQIMGDQYIHQQQIKHQLMQNYGIHPASVSLSKSNKISQNQLYIEATLHEEDCIYVDGNCQLYFPQKKKLQPKKLNSLARFDFYKQFASYSLETKLVQKANLYIRQIKTSFKYRCRVHLEDGSSFCFVPTANHLVLSAENYFGRFQSLNFKEDRLVENCFIAKCQENTLEFNQKCGLKKVKILKIDYEEAKKGKSFQMYRIQTRQNKSLILNGLIMNNEKALRMLIDKQLYTFQIDSQIRLNKQRIIQKLSKQQNFAYMKQLPQSDIILKCKGIQLKLGKSLSDQNILLNNIIQLQIRSSSLNNVKQALFIGDTSFVADQDGRMVTIRQLSQIYNLPSKQPFNKKSLIVHLQGGAIKQRTIKSIKPYPNFKGNLFKIVLKYEKDGSLYELICQGQNFIKVTNQQNDQSFLFTVQNLKNKGCLPNHQIYMINQDQSAEPLKMIQIQPFPFEGTLYSITLDERPQKYQLLANHVVCPNMRGLMVIISYQNNHIPDFFRNLRAKTVREVLQMLGCKRKLLSLYGAYFNGFPLSVNDQIGKIDQSQMSLSKGEIHLKLQPIEKLIFLQKNRINYGLCKDNEEMFVTQLFNYLAHKNEQNVGDAKADLYCKYLSTNRSTRNDSTVYKLMDRFTHKFSEGEVFYWDDFTICSTTSSPSNNNPPKTSFSILLNQKHFFTSSNQIVILPPYTHFIIRSISSSQICLEELPSPMTCHPKNSIILWVDDNPQYNNPLITKIQKLAAQKEQYIQFMIIRDTQTALIWRDIFGADLINLGISFKCISDMSRKQKRTQESDKQKKDYPQAGIDLIQKFQQLHLTTKIMIFCWLLKENRQKIELRKLEEEKFYNITNEYQDIINYCFDGLEEV